MCSAYVSSTSHSLSVPISIAQGANGVLMLFAVAASGAHMVRKAANSSVCPCKAWTFSPLPASFLLIDGSFMPSHSAALLAVMAPRLAANHAAVLWGINGRS